MFFSCEIELCVRSSFEERKGIAADVQDFDPRPEPSDQHWSKSGDHLSGKVRRERLNEYCFTKLRLII
jgi:hypothetical protein